MGNIQFDWRWVALIIIVIIIANGQRLPWPVLFLALGGGGGYVMYMGWRVWNGGTAGSRSRVTYWRGQRIEQPARRTTGFPPLKAIVPALPYLILGGALVLAALAVLFSQFGIF